jgi:hypothetical protein
LASKRKPEPAEAEPTIPPVEQIRITPPKLISASIQIRGISPYVQNAFSEKARQQIEATQRAGSQSRTRKVREAKQFEELLEAATHRSREGWIGFPAAAIRNACIDACRLVGFKMTFAKLSLFCEADGVDPKDGTPLVRIDGTPERHEGAVRNASGVVDLRWRPIFYEWGATVRLTWDGDQFSATDVLNLLHRAGMQVGIGEGRPNSPNSNGLGWGRFEVVR